MAMAFSFQVHPPPSVRLLLTACCASASRCRPSTLCVSASVNNVAPPAGYTRSVNLTDNEFSWIGCNPMASWGFTNENDGMDGQQPRYTYVARNYVHEWGHFEKQSSMWSNNKACLVQVEGNVSRQLLLPAASVRSRASSAPPELLVSVVHADRVQRTTRWY